MPVLDSERTFGVGGFQSIVAALQIDAMEKVLNGDWEEFHET